MDEVQGLANQLGWCITSHDYLTNLKDELGYTKHRYEASLDMLASEQYLSEFRTQFIAQQKDFSDTVLRLQNHVESDHLEFIDGEAKRIYQVLNLLTPRSEP